MRKQPHSLGLAKLRFYQNKETTVNDCYHKAPIDLTDIKALGVQYSVLAPQM